MKTSVPRMFSSIWNETSLSGKRRSRAWPTGMPRKSAISRVNCGWALPENTFRSPNPVDISPSPLSGLLILGDPVAPLFDTHDPHPPWLPASARTSRVLRRGFGWGGRIRTFEYGIQSPAPYRLATPHHVSFATDRSARGDGH